jgi:hypothetical protein
LSALIINITPIVYSLLISSTIVLST